MKRVALFPSAFHPSLGGVEELTGQLALHLKKSGVNTMIFVNQWPRSLAAVEKWKGFTVRRFPFRLPEESLRAKVSFYLSHLRILRGVIQALERFRAEVVHVQCVSSNAWYAHCAAAALKLPVVISIQGERTMDAHGIYSRSPLYNRVLRKVLFCANKVTACSAATLGDAEAFLGYRLGERGKVIYNGVGSEAFEKGPKWPHPHPYMLALGRLVPQKGFDALFKGFAAAGLAGTDLLIAGDGPEKAGLKTLALNIGIGERVHFVGKAGRQMVHALMRGAKGLVVPSLREPMGIVALEGMAAGIPLLVSSVDGLREIVSESQWCRHVIPGDVEGLGRGLRWLDGVKAVTPLDSQQVRAQDFLWDRIVGEYRDVYAQVSRGC